MTRVVITGMGALTPVGNTVEESWQALTAGRSGIARITQFDPSNLKSEIAGEVKGFDPVALFGARDARRMDRFTQFALAATAQAVADSGIDLSAIESQRVGVIMGTGVGGLSTLVQETIKMTERGTRFISPHLIPMMLPDTAPGKIAIEYGIRGPNLSISTACASATNAIGEAAEMIRRGTIDVAVTGGAEAGIVEIALAGFGNMGALSSRNDEPEAASRPFEADRDGFVCGEGAGVLILESEAHALARGATIHAELVGYGSSADAHHITAPLETGEGAVIAMRAALESAGLNPEDIDYVNAHGTGTPLNDSSETHALKLAFGEHAYDLQVSSTKSMTGHLLGAAGAIEAIFTALTVKTGIIPPTINYDTPDPECDLNYVPNTAREAEVNAAMSTSFGFGGHNACIIVGRYTNGR
ncbi:MAG: beta-ketoacyl-ACP synthase II [Chloroflexi bacterium]|nr:beta-ketoacyl-ACP synthase II [Chloroflexota bacterium]